MGKFNLKGRGKPTVLVDETIRSEGIEKPSDIDKLLAGYEKEVIPEQPVDTTPQGDTEETQYRINPHDKTDPRLYYQKGAKKGQKKPNFDKVLQQSGQYDPATLSGEILSGLMFITLVDMLFPLLITSINNMYSKKKIKADQLKLTAKQKNELAPICDKIVEKWNITADPVWLLVISMVGIYGVNYITLISNE